jgi:GNAT superfamily N-acetyltransferase
MSQLAMLLPVRPSSPSVDPTHGIRLATEADNQALADLLGASFPEFEWTAERVQDELTGFDEISAVFVLNDGDRIIATAAARHWPERFPGMGFLAWVAVDTTYRGRGLGRAIVARAIDQFVADGHWPAILETDDERLPAMSTYLGLGFIPHYLDEDHEGRWSGVFSAMNGVRRGQRNL